MNTILPMRPGKSDNDRSFDACDSEDLTQALTQAEVDRWARHPVSRWYVCPLTLVLARFLDSTRFRPWHVTVVGAMCIAVAVTVLCLSLPAWGALFIWLAWLCDRLDGTLARLRQATSKSGAWLDANVDEAGDLALHAGAAMCAAALFSAMWPWALFAVFAAAKYLWRFGMEFERELEQTASPHNTNKTASENPEKAKPRPPQGRQSRGFIPAIRGGMRFLGNADVRVHVLILSLGFSRPGIALAYAAGYFSLRAGGRAAAVLYRLHRNPAKNNLETPPAAASPSGRKEAA